MERSWIGKQAALAVGYFCLAEGDTPGVVRFLSQSVQLADGATQTWVTLTRTGNFSDPRYGEFAITLDMLGQMVDNFNKRVLGQDVFIDVSHKPSDGAAGKVLKLSVESGRLRALVEWTPFGVDAIKQRGFTYLSAEYHEAWKDNEKQQPHGCVLLGAGLTVRPVIKHLEPVQLSDDYDHARVVRTAISPSLLKELSELNMDKFLKLLAIALGTIGFADASAKPFTDLLAMQLAALDPAKDEAKCLAAVDAVKASAEAAMAQAKAAGADPKHVTIQLAAPQVDVAAAVAKALADQAAAQAAGATAMAGKLKLLSDTIAEGDKTLTPEGVKKFADDYAPMVTAATTDDQVKHLAGLAVKQAQELGAARKLAGLGYKPASGSVHITVDSMNGVRSLQQTIDQRLGLTDGDAQRFDRTGGKLLAANKDVAEKALAEFDAVNGERLLAEHRALAAGTGSVSDVAIPAIVERTVLRESLYNLVSMGLMDTGTASFAAVFQVPYSYRDLTAAGVSGLRRYEGQGIRRAGVVQTTEEARPIPQKLAFLLSSEMQLLMSASAIDYAPIAENVRNIIRIVGEDTEALNFNEIVNAGDEFAVTAINDTLTAQVNGTNAVFVTTKFPVVRPRKVFDLKGGQVGSTVNPLVVTLNAVARSEYVLPADGSALAVGIYYVMDYNLGELRFVNESGASVVPTNGWALTVTGSASTNASKFDTDAVNGESIGDRYDRLLTAIGNRKVVVGNDRFYSPDLVLLSAAVDNALTQASSFKANGARLGDSLSADGSVGVTKGLPTFNPKAPGLQLADTRIVVGQRRQSRFRMMKPFAMTPMEQARNASGLFTDQQESFGTQWVISHTPTQLKGACSSIILYSSSGRVARAA